MNLYTPSQIRKLGEGAVNKAYSALRSVANKRIQRMTAQGLGRGTSQFPTIQQIKESYYGDVRSALGDVSKFLKSPRTTVKGEKKFIKEFQETMTDKGYGDLVQTREDIYKMIDFMEDLREQYSDKLFDSGDALDVLQQGQRLKIPADKLRENYDIFASNIEAMEKLRPSPKGAAFSQRRINNFIKKFS